jgi:flagellar basal-body rod protein FlgF
MDPAFPPGEPPTAGESNGPAMDSTNYIALSRQTALRREMDMIAHNLANLSTGAYKAERPLFVEFIEPQTDGRPLAYVEDRGTVRDLSEGPIIHTGNDLDLAIHGDAYFVLETPRGERYSRNGHFQVSDDNKLVTSSGNYVLDVDSRQIVIPQGETDITISPEGAISGRLGPIAQLNLAAFDNPRSLTREADSLYIAEDRPQEARDVKLVQGSLENANVKPVLELSRMIDVLRSYQSTSDLIERDAELQRNTIEKVMSA